MKEILWVALAYVGGLSIFTVLPSSSEAANANSRSKPVNVKWTNRVGFSGCSGSACTVDIIVSDDTKCSVDVQQYDVIGVNGRPKTFQITLDLLSHQGTCKFGCTVGGTITRKDGVYFKKAGVPWTPKQVSDYQYYISLNTPLTDAGAYSFAVQISDANGMCHPIDPVIANG